MRGFFYIVCSAIVIGLAYWAYKENYKTQATLREVRELQLRIAAQKEAIAVLRAEWAYLNRPDRLRELVDLNFSELQLIPLMPSHFGSSGMISYPAAEVIDVNEPVKVIAKELKDGEMFP